MIDRVCISINNRCNLSCAYCHFRDKSESISACDMDVFVILDNIREYIVKYDIELFKIGFVGNGEPFLDYENLKDYILYIDDLLQTERIKAYTITNGTVVDEDQLKFLKAHKINVGFSLDGPKDIHNKYRCNSYDRVLVSIEKYRHIYGYYPSLNCTVGNEAIDDPDRIVDFFAPFDSRITFSRMIGDKGISLEDFHVFMDNVCSKLNVRTGGYDCTMYGGLCGAGINNVFYANRRIYMCGNCIDLESLPYDTPLNQIKFSVKDFDRHFCYKESVVV